MQISTLRTSKGKALIFLGLGKLRFEDEILFRLRFSGQSAEVRYLLLIPIFLNKSGAPCQ
jgi:hypothetical protein